MKSNPWVGIGSLFVLGAVLALGAAVYLFILPEVYQATARIRMDPAEPELPGQDENLPAYGPGPIVFSWNEVLLAKSVLFQVITNLELDRKWAIQQRKESPFTIPETYSLLRERIEIRQLRSTSLASVRIQSVDPSEAALIANQVIEVYRDQRESDRAAIIAAFLERMKEKRSSLEKQIQQFVDEPGTTPNDSAQRSLLKQQLLIAQHQIDEKIAAAAKPHSPVVQIIERAERPSTPIRPNGFLGSAVLVLGAGLDLAAVLLFLQRRLTPRSTSS